MEPPPSAGSTDQVNEAPAIAGVGVAVNGCARVSWTVVWGGSTLIWTAPGSAGGARSPKMSVLLQAPARRSAATRQIRCTILFMENPVGVTRGPIHSMHA